jgi:hypothetical protein
MASFTVHDIRSSASKVLGVQWANNPSIRAEVDAHAVRYLGDLHRLSIAWVNKARWRRARVDDALKSYSGGLCSAIRAANRLGIQMNYDQLQSVALTTPWHRHTEPVTLVPEFKPNGKIRWTLAYGLRRRTQQNQVGDVLKVILNFSPHDYSLRGRGAHKAVRELVCAAAWKKDPLTG